MVAQVMLAKEVDSRDLRYHVHWTISMISGFHELPTPAGRPMKFRNSAVNLVDWVRFQLEFS